MTAGGRPAALRADGFAEDVVRERARVGAAAVFPELATYGRALYGGGGTTPADGLDALRLVPPVFVPLRLEKLVDLAREPTYRDVDLRASVGGFRTPLPVYVSAFGSTRVAGADLGRAVARQAGALGLPMVIGENVVPVNGYGRLGPPGESALLGRLQAYGTAVPDGLGGVVVQQSTEDADAEVWNLVYSDPSAQPLLDSGRLGFELKVGQGAKPGLGGMTVVAGQAATRLGDQYLLDPVYGAGADAVLRSSAPGTFTPEILAHQIHLMRNNYPRARVWVKLPPARDVAEAAGVAWAAGADAVTVDGAEGGTGWAPLAFLDHVGLPLVECLRRIGRSPSGPLLVSGRMWSGARAVKALALGADAVGLGRAALLAADTDPEAGLVRLVEALELEIRLLVSALGRYATTGLSEMDVWSPETTEREAQPV
ncbi:glutamate synthase-related protein [Micromonospora sp. WMMD882]|uniref:glutamate synthase-related protein n=1 Tax=Micromonospora sp. WMMD882 TaxID=3015151 RepID=UPI00248B0578|nr:glutamate synthase-related protein [Micromonospora sp. WMMD882]WBB80960.1 glutamate synthase-related protein [Micromonospora sp. WMMD882]